MRTTGRILPRVDVMSPQDARWTGVLAEMNHDVYHMPKYVELEARREGGQPLAILASYEGTEVFLPLIVRRFRSDASSRILLDATSPYGYASPLLAGREPASLGSITKIVASIVECLDDLGVCCAFIRLHPLLPFPKEALMSSGMLVTHGETVYADLSVSDEELWHQTRPRDRTHIARLRREGFVAYVDEVWAQFEVFKRIYRETMNDVGAAEAYLFEDTYFDGLRDGLQDQLKLIVVKSESETAAAGLFTERCGTVQYHLSGTARLHRQHGPTRLLLEFARTWAKARGNRWLHLGGGVGGSADSLLRFKSGFSKLRASFSTWRAVISPNVYAAAVRGWEARAGVSAESLDGFFPAYRKVAPWAVPFESVDRKRRSLG